MGWKTLGDLVISEDRLTVNTVTERGRSESWLHKATSEAAQSSVSKTDQPYVLSGQGNIRNWRRCMKQTDELLQEENALLKETIGWMQAGKILGRGNLSPPSEPAPPAEPDFESLADDECGTPCSSQSRKGTTMCCATQMRIIQLDW